jgi:hypothetical protein
MAATEVIYFPLYTQVVQGSPSPFKVKPSHLFEHSPPRL